MAWHGREGTFWQFTIATIDPNTPLATATVVDVAAVGITVGPTIRLHSTAIYYGRCREPDSAAGSGSASPCCSCGLTMPTSTAGGNQSATSRDFNLPSRRYLQRSAARSAAGSAITCGRTAEPSTSATSAGTSGEVVESRIALLAPPWPAIPVLPFWKPAPPDVPCPPPPPVPPL